MNYFSTTVTRMSLLSGFVFVFITNTFAGGSSGNGSGGDRSVKGMNPTPGIGQALANLKGWHESYDSDEFQKKYNVQLIACDNRPEHSFPPLPKALEGKIIVNLKTGKPISIQDICKRWDSNFSHNLFYNHDAAFEAYRALMFSLYSMVDSKPISAMIDKSVELTQKPIEIRIVDHRKKIPVRGKNIFSSSEEEPAWMTNGILYWGPRKGGRDLFSSLVGRTSKSFLAHELAHIFTYRVYGGYPAVKFWHDERFEVNIYSKEGGFTALVGSNLYKFETSEKAAFLETFSNLMELPFALEHPKVAHSWSGSPSYFQDYQEELVAVRDERFRGPLRNLLKNEVYLTTILEKFVKRSYIKPGEYANYVKASDDVLLTMLQAILQDRQLTDDQFLKMLTNYDQISNKDEAQKLAVEYLAYDLKKSRDLREDFTILKSEKGDEFVSTNNRITEDMLYSPYESAESKKVFEQMRHSYAEGISREQLIKNLDEVIAKYDPLIQAAEKAAPDLDKIANRERNRLKKELEKATDQKSWDFATDVQDKMVPRGGWVLIAAVDIDRILKRMAQEEDIASRLLLDLKSDQEKIKTMRMQIAEKMDLATNTEGHFNDVFAWHATKDVDRTDSVRLLASLPETLEAMSKIK